MATAFKVSPSNYFKDFGEFESWSNGTLPDGWTAATAPLLAQETTFFKFGLNSARVIGSTGAGAVGLYRTLPNPTDYKGRTFRLGVWGKSSSTGPYIEINDGVASKTVHLDGSNAFVFTTTPPMKLDYANTQLRINLYASQTATAYFDGAVLVEGEDLVLNLLTNYDVGKWSPSLSLKSDQYEISQREGSIIPETHLGSKSIRLSGNVVGSDAVNTRANFDDLGKFMLAWRPEEKRELYFYDDRIAEVFLSSFDNDHVSGLQMIKWNAQFKNPDASTRSIGRYRNKAVIATSVTEFNFSYGGNAKSLPRIQFIANQAVAITTCTLQNLTTGESFSFTGSIGTNASLDVDSYLGTVTNSSVNSVANFTGDFIGIVRGTNYFRFSGSNCELRIDYFNRWIT